MPQEQKGWWGLQVHTAVSAACSAGRECAADKSSLRSFQDPSAPLSCCTTTCFRPEEGKEKEPGSSQAAVSNFLSSPHSPALPVCSRLLDKLVGLRAHGRKRACPDAAGTPCRNSLTFQPHAPARPPCPPPPTLQQRCCRSAQELCCRPNDLGVHQTVWTIRLQAFIPDQ